MKADFGRALTRKLYLKPVSLVVVVCLLLEPPAALAHEASGKDALHEYASIEASYVGTSGKTIYFIQDAHTSLEAQGNIAKLIRYFVNEQGIRTVMEEGYEGPVPTDAYFGFIKSPEMKQKVSYFLMDKLRLSGAEYAHINRPKNFALIGADSIRLHLENIAAYQKAARSSKEVARDLDVLEKHLKRLAYRQFSAPLKEWLKLREKFEAEKIPFGDYLKRLSQIYLRFGHSQPFESRFPLADLVLKAEKTRENKLIEEIKAVEPAAIFEELRRIEDAVTKHYLAGEKQRQIYNYYQKVSLLRRLNRMELTEEEFLAAQKILAELRTEKIASFVASETKKSMVLSRRWEKEIQNAIRFYETARLREKSTASALDQFLSNPEESKAMLAFGGFHRKAIEKMLRDRNVSYFVLAPKIRSLDKRHEENYRQLMSVGHYPFETPVNVSKATRPPSIFLRVFQVGAAEVRYELQTVTDRMANRRGYQEGITGAGVSSSDAVRRDKYFQRLPQIELIGLREIELYHPFFIFLSKAVSLGAMFNAIIIIAKMITPIPSFVHKGKFPIQMETKAVPQIISEILKRLLANKSLRYGSNMAGSIGSATTLVKHKNHTNYDYKTIEQRGRNRSELRREPEEAREEANPWLTDPDKADWSRVSKAQKRFLVQAILDAAGETPNGILENPEIFFKEAIPFLNGKTLKSLYQFYDEQRKRLSLPFSTARYILFETGFLFDGRDEIEDREALISGVSRDQIALFAQAAKEIELEKWMHLFETNQTALYYLMATQFPKLDQNALLRLLSEKFLGMNGITTKPFSFEDLKNMENVLAKLWNRETRHILIYQIRLRLYNHVVKQSGPANGDQANQAMEIYTNWVKSRLADKKLKDRTVRLIYRSIRRYYSGLKHKNYQRHIHLKDEQGNPVYLRLHQLEGIDFGMRNRRFILGDEMGVGKTPQALAFIEALDADRVVIVASKTLLANWKREIEKWLGSGQEVTLIDGVANVRLANVREAKKHSRFILINYDALRNQEIVDELNRWKPQVKIGDEIHRLRNPDTQESSGYRQLKSDYVMNLSGSPVVNDFVDLWTALHDVDPVRFPSFIQFEKEFSGGELDYVRLNMMMNLKYFLRRTLADVMVHLPEIHPIRFMPVALDQEQIDTYLREIDLYNKLPKTQRFGGAQKRLMQILVDLDFYYKNKGVYQHKAPAKLTEALRIAKQVDANREASAIFGLNPDVIRHMELMLTLEFGSPELKNLFSRIEKVFEENDKPTRFAKLTGLMKEMLHLAPSALYVKHVKRLIDFYAKPEDTDFSKFTQVSLALGEMMQKPEYQDRDTVASIYADEDDPEARMKQVQRFQTNPKIKVFLATYGIGSEGITLTKASHVIFIDLPPTKIQLEQAIGRLAREGQTKPVNTYVLIAWGSHDERSKKIIERKETIFDQIVNARIGRSDNERMMMEMESGIRERSQVEIARAMLAMIYEASLRGDYEKAAQMWSESAGPYSDVLEKIAAFPIAQSWFLYLIELHKKGELNLKKARKWLFAPSGPSTEVRAMATLDKQFRQIGINIGRLNFHERDISQVMLDTGRKVLENLGLRSMQGIYNLVEDRFPEEEYDFVISTELWGFPNVKKVQVQGKWVDAVNQRGIIQRYWALAQLASAAKKGGYLILGAHNKKFTSEAREFLKEFGLELIHPEVDHVKIEGLPFAIQRQIEKSGFVLARKVKSIRFTEKFLAALPENRLDFFVESRPVSELGERQKKADTKDLEGKGGDFSKLLTDYYKLQTEEEPKVRIAQMTERDKSLNQHYLDLVAIFLNGPPTAETPGKILDIIHQIKSLSPGGEFIDKVRSYLRFQFHQKFKESGPIHEALETALRNLELIASGSADSGSVKPEPETKVSGATDRAPARKRGRPRKSGKEKLDLISQSIIKGGDLLTLFDHKGFRFAVSDVPIRQGIRLDPVKNIFFVDSYLAREALLKPADTAKILNLMAYQYLEVYFQAAHPDKAETAKEVRHVLMRQAFEPLRRENEDLKILESLDPARTELFYFFLDLRRIEWVDIESEKGRSELRTQLAEKANEISALLTSDLAQAQKAQKRNEPFVLKPELPDPNDPDIKEILSYLRAKTFPEAYDERFVKWVGREHLESMFRVLLNRARVYDRLVWMYEDRRTTPSVRNFIGLIFIVLAPRYYYHYINGRIPVNALGDEMKGESHLRAMLANYPEDVESKGRSVSIRTRTQNLVEEAKGYTSYFAGQPMTLRDIKLHFMRTASFAAEFGDLRHGFTALSERLLKKEFLKRHRNQFYGIQTTNDLEIRYQDKEEGFYDELSDKFRHYREVSIWRKNDGKKLAFLGTGYLLGNVSGNWMLTAPPERSELRGSYSERPVILRPAKQAEESLRSEILRRKTAQDDDRQLKMTKDARDILAVLEMDLKGMKENMKGAGLKSESPTEQAAPPAENKIEENLKRDIDQLNELFKDLKTEVSLDPDVSRESPGFLRIMFDSVLARPMESEDFGRWLRYHWLPVLTGRKYGDWARLHENLMDILAGQAASEPVKELIRRIYVALFPEQVIPILTRQMESKQNWPQLLDREWQYTTLDNYEMGNPHRRIRDEESASSVIDSRYLHPPSKKVISPVRVAAMLAFHGLRKGFDPPTERILINDFKEHFYTLELGQKIKGGFRIRVRADTTQHKLAFPSEVVIAGEGIDGQEIFLARLGTGYTPGNIQGRWYVNPEWIKPEDERTLADWDFKRLQVFLRRYFSGLNPGTIGFESSLIGKLLEHYRFSPGSRSILLIELENILMETLRKSFISRKAWQTGILILSAAAPDYYDRLSAGEKINFDVLEDEIYRTLEKMKADYKPLEDLILSDTHLEKLDKLLGRDLLKELWSGSYDGYRVREVVFHLDPQKVPAAARGTKEIHDRDKGWQYILRKVNDSSVSRECRIILKRILTALAPDFEPILSRYDRITMSNLSSLEKEIEKEYARHQFEKRRVNFSGYYSARKARSWRLADEQGEAIIHSGYPISLRFLDYPIPLRFLEKDGVDLSTIRYASMLARGGLPNGFTRKSREWILAHFFTQAVAKTGRGDIDFESLSLKTTEHTAASKKGRPKRTSIVEIYQGDEPIARLGTGYEPGNLQGRWYWMDAPAAQVTVTHPPRVTVTPSGAESSRSEIRTGKPKLKDAREIQNLLRTDLEQLKKEEKKSVLPPAKAVKQKDKGRPKTYFLPEGSLINFDRKPEHRKGPLEFLNNYVAAYPLIVKTKASPPILILDHPDDDDEWLLYELTDRLARNPEKPEPSAKLSRRDGSSVTLFNIRFSTVTKEEKRDYPEPGALFQIRRIQITSSETFIIWRTRGDIVPIAREVNNEEIKPKPQAATFVTEIPRRDSTDQDVQTVWRILSPVSVYPEKYNENFGDWVQADISNLLSEDESAEGQTGPQPTRLHSLYEMMTKPETSEEAKNFIRLILVTLAPMLYEKILDGSVTEEELQLEIEKEYALWNFNTDRRVPGLIDAANDAASDPLARWMFIFQFRHGLHLKPDPVRMLAHIAAKRSRWFRPPDLETQHRLRNHILRQHYHEWNWLPRDFVFGFRVDEDRVEVSIWDKQKMRKLAVLGTGKTINNLAGRWHPITSDNERVNPPTNLSVPADWVKAQTAPDTSRGAVKLELDLSRLVNLLGANGSQVDFYSPDFGIKSRQLVYADEMRLRKSGFIHETSKLLNRELEAGRFDPVTIDPLALKIFAALTPDYYARFLSTRDFRDSGFKVAARREARLERFIKEQTAKGHGKNTSLAARSFKGWEAGIHSEKRLLLILLNQIGYSGIFKKSLAPIRHEFFKMHKNYFESEEDIELRQAKIRGLIFPSTLLAVRKWDKQVIAWLGTGFSPGNLEGQWYLAPEYSRSELRSPSPQPSPKGRGSLSAFPSPRRGEGRVRGNSGKVSDAREIYRLLQGDLQALREPKPGADSKIAGEAAGLSGQTLSGQKGQDEIPSSPALPGISPVRQKVIAMSQKGVKELDWETEKELLVEFFLEHSEQLDPNFTPATGRVDMSEKGIVQIRQMPDLVAQLGTKNKGGKAGQWDLIFPHPSKSLVPIQSPEDVRKLLEHAGIHYDASQPLSGYAIRHHPHLLRLTAGTWNQIFKPLLEYRLTKKWDDKSDKYDLVNRFFLAVTPHLKKFEAEDLVRELLSEDELHGFDLLEVRHWNQDFTQPVDLEFWMGQAKEWMNKSWIQVTPARIAGMHAGRSNLKLDEQSQKLLIRDFLDHSKSASVYEPEDLEIKILPEKQKFPSGEIRDISRIAIAVKDGGSIRAVLGNFFEPDDVQGYWHPIETRLSEASYDRIINRFRRHDSSAHRYLLDVFEHEYSVHMPLLSSIPLYIPNTRLDYPKGWILYYEPDGDDGRPYLKIFRQSQDLMRVNKGDDSIINENAFDEDSFPEPKRVPEAILDVKRPSVIHLDNATFRNFRAGKRSGRVEITLAKEFHKPERSELRSDIFSQLGISREQLSKHPDQAKELLMKAFESFPHLLPIAEEFVKSHWPKDAEKGLIAAAANWDQVLAVQLNEAVSAVKRRLILRGAFSIFVSPYLGAGQETQRLAQKWFLENKDQGFSFRSQLGSTNKTSAIQHLAASAIRGRTHFETDKDFEEYWGTNKAVAPADHYGLKTKGLNYPQMVRLLERKLTGGKILELMESNPRVSDNFAFDLNNQILLKRELLGLASERGITWDIRDRLMAEIKKSSGNNTSEPFPEDFNMLGIAVHEALKQKWEAFRKGKLLHDGLVDQFLSRFQNQEKEKTVAETLQLSKQLFVRSWIDDERSLGRYIQRTVAQKLVRHFGMKPEILDITDRSISERREDPDSFESRFWDFLFWDFWRDAPDRARQMEQLRFMSDEAFIREVFNPDSGFYQQPFNAALIPVQTLMNQFEMLPKAVEQTKTLIEESVKAQAIEAPKPISPSDQDSTENKRSELRSAEEILQKFGISRELLSRPDQAKELLMKALESFPHLLPIAEEFVKSHWPKAVEKGLIAAAANWDQVLAVQLNEAVSAIKRRLMLRGAFAIFVSPYLRAGQETQRLAQKWFEDHQKEVQEGISLRSQLGQEAKWRAAYQLSWMATSTEWRKTFGKTFGSREDATNHLNTLSFNEISRLLKAPDVIKELQYVPHTNPDDIPIQEIMGRAREKGYLGSIEQRFKQQILEAMPVVEGVAPLEIDEEGWDKAIEETIQPLWKQFIRKRILHDGLVDQFVEQFRDQGSPFAENFIAKAKVRLTWVLSRDLPDDNPYNFAYRMGAKAFENRFGRKAAAFEDKAGQLVNDTINDRFIGSSKETPVGLLAQKWTPYAADVMPFDEILKMIGNPSSVFYQSILTAITPAVQALMTEFNLAPPQPVSVQSEKPGAEPESAPAEPFSVMTELKVFAALSPEQREEFYKLFAHYAGSPNAEFVFVGDASAIDQPLMAELFQFRDEFKNIKFRAGVDAERLADAKRTILCVTKEGFKDLFGPQGKIFRILYPRSELRAGLLVAALRLLEGGKENVLSRSRYFSEIPREWAEDIREFLKGYVYVKSAA